MKRSLKRPRNDRKATVRQRRAAPRAPARRVLEEEDLASVAGGSNPLANVEAMGKIAMKSLVINGGALAGAASTILQSAGGSKSGQGGGGTIPL